MQGKISRYTWADDNISSEPLSYVQARHHRPNTGRASAPPDSFYMARALLHLCSRFSQRRPGQVHHPFHRQLGDLPPTHVAFSITPRQTHYESPAAHPVSSPHRVIRLLLRHAPPPHVFPHLL